MAGPWEKYQQQESGPWAQYQRKADFSDVHAAKSSTESLSGGRANDSQFAQLVSGRKRAPATYNLTGTPGVSTQLGGMLDAFQHHALGPLHGTSQLLRHGLNAGANAMLPDGSGLRRYINESVAEDDSALRRREEDYQARTDGNVGAYIGAAPGEILPWMFGLGQLRAAGLLPKVSGTGVRATLVRGGLLAGEGAAMGAAQPVTNGEFAEQKAKQAIVGGAVAPAVGAGLSLAKVAGRGARYLTGSGRDAIANERVAKLYGNSPETVAALRRQPDIPGYTLTPAQTIGTPEAVQAERVLRNSGITGPAFAAQESSNNLALRNEVARLAGTDAEMAGALAARREGPGAFWRENLALGAEDGRFGRAAKHLEEYSNSKMMPVAEFRLLDEARKIASSVQRGTIDALEGERRLAALTPATKGGKKALEQAATILNRGMVNPTRIVSELERLSRSGNRTISQAAEGHLATIAKNQDATGWVHARVLDDMRQNIGVMLKQNAPDAVIGSKESALYGPLKAKITNTLDRSVPGYRDNLASYARASQPINDMEAGRSLLGAIDSGGRDAGGNQAVSLSQVKSLLSRDNRADFPMSDAARSRVEGVLDALQRRSISNNTIAAAGPGTAADTLRGGLQSPLAQRAISGLGAVAGSTIGGFPGALLGYGLSEGAIGLSNSVARNVGQKAANAKLTADAIEAYQRQLMNQQGLLGRQPDYLLAPLLPYVE